MTKRSDTPGVCAIELGCAGHLIVANSCRWKRHTQVGNYRVSTIGDYYGPDLDRIDGDRNAKKRDTIGGSPDSFFETMVFETTGAPAKDNEGCGCHAVKDWGGIECDRYRTAGEAQAGHERYVAKYLEIANGKS